MHLVNKYKPQKTLGELNNYIKVFTLNNFTLITKFDKGYLLKKIEVNNKTSIFLFNNLIKQYFFQYFIFFLLQGLHQGNILGKLCCIQQNLPPFHPSRHNYMLQPFLNNHQNKDLVNNNNQTCSNG